MFLYNKLYEDSLFPEKILFTKIVEFYHQEIQKSPDQII